MLLDRIRDARFSNGVYCPRCGHRQVQCWGTFSDRQRYRCKACRRTFSDLTGTPAAYLKKIELLPSYCAGLAAQLSVRHAALRLGIHASTAFRWRHRLLDGLRARDDQTLSGWIELGSFWLPESHKGQRQLERRTARPPRSRGTRGRRRTRGRRNLRNLFYDGPRVHVVVACDRTGRVVSAAHPHPTYGPLPTGALETALQERLEHLDSLNLTASRETRSAAITFASRIGAAYHDAFLPPGRLPRWMRRTRLRIRVRPGERSLAHVRTVLPYIRRFGDWLRFFRGVATKYLPNYLLWHRLSDAHVRNRFTSILLRWQPPPEARG